MKKGCAVMVIAMLVCAFAGSLYAAEKSTPMTGSERKPMTSDPTMRSGDFLNRNIMSEKGETLGRVSDIVYDRNGNPQYLILSRDNKFYPIPYSSVTMDPATRSFTLRNMDMNKLWQAPSFTESERNRLGQAEFDKKVYGYYGTEYPSRGLDLDRTWETQRSKSIPQEKVGAGTQPGHPESGTGKFSQPTVPEKR